MRKENIDGSTSESLSDIQSDEIKTKEKDIEGLLKDTEVYN